MDQVIHIKTITQLLDSYKVDKPSHPLIGVVDLSKVAVDEAMTNIRVMTDMYSVTLKTKTSGKLKYGRSVIDFEEGSLYGTAPRQVMEVSEAASVGDLEGWVLYFHPDLIRGNALGEKILTYKFFHYDTNEALHLSEEEKAVLNSIVLKIKQEAAHAIDEFSKDILVSTIELLLNYIKRYYSRQFITRKTQNTDFLAQFEYLVKAYFNSKNIEEDGLPTVHHFAQALHLSSSYLSDLLKKETGKNAQEHIHYHLIDKAKSLLLENTSTVAEIAYSLGFEHPPYFSRLFKKKTGVSPSQYRFNVQH